MIKLTNMTSNTSYLFSPVDSWIRHKSYQLIVAPLPLGESKDTIIQTLLGVSDTVDINFKIIPRDTDYTDGTGTPSVNNKYDEATWLTDTVLAGSDVKYSLYNSKFSTTYFGTVADTDIPIIGDNPNNINAKLTFQIGILPGK